MIPLPVWAMKRECNKWRSCGNAKRFFIEEIMAEMDAAAYWKRGGEYSEKGDYDLAIADLT